ncbi:unnamed protein product [Parnassius apollo]|uniref:(apollo) hypothetical protein n=1 Tax=Parnassius apollo TaxID=110799 RepID=A0A8S3XHP8_PARAO|nr:unnamed protein product [Parnassius apollo]
MDISDLDFDLDISQEDLQHIEALESSIFSEIRNFSEEEISNDAILPARKRYRRVIASNSESESGLVENYISNQIARIENTSNSVQKWTRPQGHQPSVIAFTEPTGKC